MRNTMYERLTKRDRYGHAYTNETIYDRGMTSEDGAHYEKHYFENGTSAYDGKPIDRLCEIEDKICEGRMVELPCKVGDTVWEVWASGSDITQIQREVRAIKVDLIYINQYDTIIHCISEEMAGHIPLSDFGKTVFLTPEEANKKLKELENE